jgi:hypothetical protein
MFMASAHSVQYSSFFQMAIGDAIAIAMDQMTGMPASIVLNNNEM